MSQFDGDQEHLRRILEADTVLALIGLHFAGVLRIAARAGMSPKTASFRFQIDMTLGAKPQTVQTYGKAKQQRVGLIWKWNHP
jgi:hypothetical protein